MPERRFRFSFRFRPAALVVVVLSFAAAILLAAARSHDLENQRKAQAAQLDAGPLVQVATARAGNAARHITFPGEAVPFQSVTLYAKVSGYLREVDVDKGDHVDAGQVLARIESPETDQQYNHARADLENKQRIAKRSRELADRHFLASQAAEQAETDVRTAQADVASLGTLKSYEILRAPFAGTVTARYADEGALIQNAETNQTSSLPVVTVADTKRLRVYCYVEQGDAPYVRAGDLAEVRDATHPERAMKARVNRVSGELDPKSRTLLTEIDVDGGMLVPGSFVNVSLEIPASGAVEVPASALLVRGQKTYVAVVDGNSRVDLRQVTLAGTDGAIARIAAGIRPGERVALDLASDVAAGAKVRPVAVPSP